MLPVETGLEHYPLPAANPARDAHDVEEAPEGQPQGGRQEAEGAAREHAGDRVHHLELVPGAEEHVDEGAVVEGLDEAVEVTGAAANGALVTAEVACPQPTPADAPADGLGGEFRGLQGEKEAGREDGIHEAPGG